VLALDPDLLSSARRVCIDIPPPFFEPLSFPLSSHRPPTRLIKAGQVSQKAWLPFLSRSSWIFSISSCPREFPSAKVADHSSYLLSTPFHLYPETPRTFIFNVLSPSLSSAPLGCVWVTNSASFLGRGPNFFRFPTCHGCRRVLGRAVLAFRPKVDAGSACAVEFSAFVCSFRGLLSLWSLVAEFMPLLMV